MFHESCKSFRKDQIKRRKRLQTKKKPKPDPLLKQLADPEYFGWRTHKKENHDAQI
jgi:hypothetical protein